MKVYVTLSKPEWNGSTINFVFGKDCGVWLTHPSDVPRTITKNIIREVQVKCRHNRRRMSKYKNWQKFIDEYTERYGLTKTEETV